MRLLLAGLVAIVVMSPLDRQTVIPVRRLRITGATDSSLKFEYLNGVRPLSDGRVFVNDLIGHRLYLFDTTMSHFTLIADTSEHASIKYAGGIAAIIPYLAIQPCSSTRTRER